MRVCVRLGGAIKVRVRAGGRLSERGAAPLELLALDGVVLSAIDARVGRGGGTALARLAHELRPVLPGPGY